MVAPPKSTSKPATVDDWRATEENDRLEIVGGEILEKAMPSPRHAYAESQIGGVLHPFNRRSGNRGPGGWWIMSEVHVEYASGELYCHDVAGWRRDHVETLPTEWPVRIRPDWVCEIASPKHEKQDMVVKPRVLHVAEVPHYWVLHPEERILIVHRWSKDGYVVVLRATSGETVHAEPFEAVEIRVGELFGDDDELVP